MGELSLAVFPDHPRGIGWDHSSYWVQLGWAGEFNTVAGPSFHPRGLSFHMLGSGFLKAPWSPGSLMRQLVLKREGSK